MEKKSKNIGYKAAIIILIALLICSNVLHFQWHSNLEEACDAHVDYLYSQLGGMYATEPIELDRFADELDLDYMYIESIEPIGFINYTTITDATGDTRGFRNVIYDATFYKITKEEANGSIEFWERNYTYDCVFSFEDAAANDFKPMQIGEMYRTYSLYHGYDFISVIYYEKVETGEIDW